MHKADIQGAHRRQCTLRRRRRQKPASPDPAGDNSLPQVELGPRVRRLMVHIEGAHCSGRHVKSGARRAARVLKSHPIELTPW
jgi:hypothetical protein